MATASIKQRKSNMQNPFKKKEVPNRAVRRAALLLARRAHRMYHEKGKSVKAIVASLKVKPEWVENVIKASRHELGL